MPEEEKIESIEQIKPIIETIEEKIKRLLVEMQNTIDEYNSCIKRTEELLGQMNYLKGKLDILKELEIKPSK